MPSSVCLPVSVCNTLCSLLKSSPWSATHSFCCALSVRSFDWVQKLKDGPFILFRQCLAINNCQRHSYKERAECLSRWWETLLCWPPKLALHSLIAILHSRMEDGVRGGKQQDKAVSQKETKQSISGLLFCNKGVLKPKRLLNSNVLCMFVCTFKDMQPSVCAHWFVDMLVSLSVSHTWLGWSSWSTCLVALKWQGLDYLLMAMGLIKGA